MSEWWRWEGWPSAEEWQAVWALVTAGIALAAAVVALRHYKSSVSNELEESRPFIVVDFLFKGAIYACIEVLNVGRTGARNIAFEWSQRPVAEDEGTQRLIDRALVDGSIPFLAPGRSIIYRLNVYDGEESKELPRRFEVKATYQGSGDTTRWTSESVLDIDQWAETSVPENPYSSIVTPLVELAKGANQRAERDKYLVKAADSINVYLEADGQVRAARHEKKIQHSQRVAHAVRREAERRARLETKQSEAADKRQDSPS